MRFFTFDGKDRITLDQIKSHPWFTKSGPSDKFIKKQIIQRYEKNNGSIGSFLLEKSQSFSSTDSTTKSDNSNETQSIFD